MTTIEKGIVHIVMNENKVKVDRKDIDQEMGKITINQTIEDYIMINKLFGNYNIASLVNVDEFKKIYKKFKNQIIKIELQSTTTDKLRL